MSSDLVGYSPQRVPAPVQPPLPFDGRSVPPEPEETIPWQRYYAAVMRFKWLVLLMGIAGTVAGFVATRFIKPQYEVSAKVWIASESRDIRNSGPIRAPDILQGASWVDLLRSFRILDQVVLKEKLYIGAPQIDRPLFAAVDIDATRLRSDAYELTIDESGGRYTLTNGQKVAVEQGAVGDSIGRSVGLKWQPPADALKSRRQVRFWLNTPRQAAIALQENLIPALPEGNSLLRVTLTGNDPRQTSSTLNAVLAEFVSAAGELKRGHVREFSRLLAGQLEYAERELRDGEMALQNFRVSTITLPAEGTVVAGGSEVTLNPVFDAYFRLKLQEDSVSHDREALERTMAGVRNGNLGVDALWSMLGTTGGSPELRAALTEYSTKESALRTAEQLYTSEHKTVRELRDGLQRLKTVIIPSLVGSQITQLRQREDDLERRIAGSASDLRAIPTRTIEELRLRQNVDTRKALYLKLKDRFEEARLAEASLAPDVTILDSAVPPQWPTQNTAPRIMMMAVVASFGFALLLAIVIDRLDPRFRYMEQATREFGLNVLGIVPKIQRRRSARSAPMAEAQLIESFRSLRLGVNYALPPGSPIALTVTSPGPGDGKSLVCSNLALAFADAGYKTLLIDGDVRRGTLHSTFGVERTPGLTDHLGGTATLEEILRPTTHQRLTLIPSGQRHSRGPESLVSAELPRLLQELQGKFDAIFIDSAPLGAGIDGYALSVTTGNVLIVLRPGITDRKLAQAKLDILSRLPASVLGAIVNDVKIGDSEYRYYSYNGNYGTETDDFTATFPTGSGNSTVKLKG